MSCVAAANAGLHALVLEVLERGFERLPPDSALRVIVAPLSVGGLRSGHRGISAAFETLRARERALLASTGQRRPQGPRRLQAPDRPHAGRGDPRARRAARGQAGPARERHRDGRRRLGDPLRAGAADARRRPRGRLAHRDRARGVLQRHEAAPQRPPGQPARPRPRRTGRSSTVQPAERAASSRATTTT